MGNSRKEIGRNKKRSRMVKSFILFFLLVILAFGSYGAYAFFNVYKAAKDSYKPIEREKGHSKYREEKATIGKNPISILLMGIEDYSSHGKIGRTDTLIVATLNPNTNQMTLLSIPRDTWVHVASENDEMDKINAAYAYGQANGYGANKAVIDTVENFLHIPIDYYVKIGFKGFVDVVNEIGGVDVDVPFTFWEKNFYDHDRHITFTQGPMHLNGEQALAYVRMRKRDPRGDFGRNDRQRQVIDAAIDQMESAGTLFKVDELSSIIGNNVETNLTLKDIYGLEKSYSKVTSNSQKFVLDNAPGHGKDGSNEKGYVYLPDEAYVQEITDALREQLELDPISDVSDVSSQTTGNDDTTSQ
jgi:polyisoprenyl-teichoic acid--peptidoglycan teichoic acid transferase